MGFAVNDSFFIPVTVTAYRRDHEGVMKEKIDHFVADPIIFLSQSDVGMVGFFQIQSRIPNIIVRKNNYGKSFFDFLFKGFHRFFRVIVQTVVRSNHIDPSNDPTFKGKIKSGQFLLQTVACRILIFGRLFHRSDTNSLMLVSTGRKHQILVSNRLLEDLHIAVSQNVNGIARTNQKRIFFFCQSKRLLKIFQWRKGRKFPLFLKYIKTFLHQTLMSRSIGFIGVRQMNVSNMQYFNRLPQSHVQFCMCKADHHAVSSSFFFYYIT